MSDGITTERPVTPPPTVAPGVAAGCGNIIIKINNSLLKEIILDCGKSVTKTKVINGQQTEVS